MLKHLLLILSLIFFPFIGEAKLPEITPPQVTKKMNEIMKSHASYKQLNPTIVKRTLLNYLEEIDPNKTYFILPDIQQWVEPSDSNLIEIQSEIEKGDFHVFQQIHEKLDEAILRRRELEKKIDYANLPKKVDPEEFKDMKWAANEQELLTRLTRIKGLQHEAAAKLSDDLREKSMQRIVKRQDIYEQEMLEKDAVQRERRVLSNVLKAFASALDTHTAYFTPDEATQFMINVQQRLFGIGAQLRDDINGFTVVKIIEGGPAANNKELKVKDRIIAVNGEPVVGLDIIDAVELIRGPEHTPVTLTVVRQTPDGENKKEETLNIKLERGEVVLKETRFEASTEAYGDGAIGYLKLFSFYQDPESSSGSDLAQAIQELKEKNKLKGLILDLRFNSGGMLSQAVAVAGLFISKGVVVSIKDETGGVQHLRHLDSKTSWDGPLIVLINRASASASEIVAGTLQDYGRALIVGDDHTYGKGSYQTFTLNSSQPGSFNPQGEYKVTRGRYYTVSGRTPQLTGVYSDVAVPGPLTEMDIGEKFSKYPLENDSIKEEFDDDLSDIPPNQRDKIRMLYKFNLQPKLTTYNKYLPTLIQNSAERIKNTKSWQAYLKEIKKKDKDKEISEQEEDSGENGLTRADLQLSETYNIMRDLLYLMLEENKAPAPPPAPVKG